MNRILVIADDLTGAAEIAGIGSRFGFTTQLVRDQVVQRPTAQLTVIDTDSRLLGPSEAATTVWRHVEPLRAGQFDLVFKKIDSVLRGPVLAEIDTMLSALNRPAALVVPQNPSRGRIIRAGEYFVEGIPLYASSFANDPQYPARTSNVLEMLGSLPQRQTACIEPGSDLLPRGVSIGAADDADDVHHWASRLSGAEQILPVGAADFFAAILEHRGRIPIRRFITSLTDESILFCVGSISSYTHQMTVRAQLRGISVCSMPDRVFDGSDRAGKAMRAWAQQICDAMEHAAPHRAMITIGQPLDRTPGAPDRIHAALAEVVALVLRERPVANLLIGGGATASAICRKMDWHEFSIAGELTTGVVQMQVGHDGQQLIVKPGSYRWPDAVWD